MQPDPGSPSVGPTVSAESGPEAPSDTPVAPGLNGRPASSSTGEPPTAQDAAMEATPDEPAGRAAGRRPSPTHSPLRYWLRPLILGVLVIILLGLTYWDQRRVPDRPVAPYVLTATPQADGTVSASDPGLTDTLARLRTALQRRDARAFSALVDPDGLTVAAFGGVIPETGYNVTDTTRFTQDILSGSQMSLLGWRNDGRGRVIVLSDGWKEKPLRLSTNSTLDLTSLSGIGLASRAGTWYVRWLLPDPNGVLAQQARSLIWQPWPNA